MKIWKVKVDFGPNEDFEDIQLADTSNKFTDEFKESVYCGKRTNGKFDNVEVNILGGNLKTDHPKLWNAYQTMVLSKRGLNALKDILKDSVEIIPLQCKGREYFVVNILNIINALNYNKSEFEVFPSGLVVDVTKYSFLKEKLEGVNIFKIFLNDRISVTKIFVSETFKNIVEENELKGFKFEEVWDSENDN